MDIKDWIETTGIKAKEIRFLKQPEYPYIIFFDEQYIKGSDNMKSIIKEHTVTIELYTKTINQNESSDKIENLILNDLEVEFRRSREWIDTDSNFLTKYDFVFLEKVRRV